MMERFRSLQDILDVEEEEEKKKKKKKKKQLD